MSATSLCQTRGEKVPGGEAVVFLHQQDDVTKLSFVGELFAAWQSKMLQAN